MNILLTEQEVDAKWKSSCETSLDSTQDITRHFARAIQLTLIEKMRKELPPTYIFPNQMNEQRLVCLPTPQELEKS